MFDEPEFKRAVSFIDGQNLFRHAKDAFGHHHPNYDPRKLTEAVRKIFGAPIGGGCPILPLLFGGRQVLARRVQ